MNKMREVYDYWNSQESNKVKDYLKACRSVNMPEDEFFLSNMVLPLFHSKSCLEIGSGPGRLVRAFSMAGVNLTASDFSQSFLPVLRGVCKKYGASYFELDITKKSLSFKYDLIFSTQVLLHIHPKYIDKAISNIVEMAASKIVLITWQGDGPFDDVDTQKIQSFNHDYINIFKKAKLYLDLELDIYFTKPNGRKVKNKVYCLHV
jgi:SAM-dependent methyltransferase